MISVIVPVYNVEAYLRQCLDSIVNQTYRDLEIIVIDDGSTDSSGIICDSYSDQRIRVLHTDNRGLSAARNVGLDEAIGEYITFVDSDDWIESNIFEQAIAEIGSADILCFGCDRHSANSGTYSGHEALCKLINGEISGAAWGKLYKKDCFKTISFPEKREHEEVATSYKLMIQAKTVISIDECGYHYRQREGSITHSHDIKNLTDHWLAYRERFEDCKELVDDRGLQKLLQGCAISIIRAWVWKNSSTKDISPLFFDMSSFVKKHYTYNVRKNLSWMIRFGLLFSKYPTRFSFYMANRCKHLDGADAIHSYIRREMYK